MDGNLSNEALITRIQQLEHERGELHKDIEQLCMQHSGPSYLSVATRMHFQRTAGLEQENEELKKKLATSLRENYNLQEELSEAYRIKSQLADLHSVEVAKSMEAEKQVRFFQGCVAAAFAERDHAIMEAEKAKEEGEVVAQKIYDFQERVERLTSECLEEKKLSASLQTDVDKQEKQNEAFKKVIDKFYEIRQHSIIGIDNTSWESKCECLLNDSVEMWSFNDCGETSTSEYITTLEEEVETLRKSVDNLQNRLRMGLEIENHLKRRVRDLEKKRVHTQEKMKGLLHYHFQHRVHIKNLLDEGYSYIKSTIDVVEEKIRQLDFIREQNLISPEADINIRENECRDVHINTDASSDSVTKKVPDMPNTPTGTDDSSEAFAQVLEEKVGALLLLSQQEERYLLDSDVKALLQKKLMELQRNLLQVTNEKVKALMELAQLKQDYQLLQEKVIHGMKKGEPSADLGDKRIVQASDGGFKNLLKKTYLRRWVNPLDSNENEAETYLDYKGNFTNKRSNYTMDFARMKIENAALKESLENMEHLTSSVHRLRLALLKVKEVVITKGIFSNKPELENIVKEAKLVRTALGISLPVSWSGEIDVSLPDDETDNVSGPSNNKVDCVSAAGFEMVELLILAAQILSDYIAQRCD